MSDAGAGGDQAEFSPIVTIEGAIELAMEMIGHQRLDYAEEVLERVLEVVPDHATALNHLGILRFHLGGAQKAVDFFNHAAMLVPDHASIRNNLGNAYVELGNIDAASEAYGEAIRLDPSLPDPYSNLASIKRHGGKVAEAEVLLRRAIELNPQNGYAHHNLGTVLMSDGRARDAIDHFWKAAALIPDKTMTSPFLALAYWNADMKDQAVSFVRKWAQMMPNDPQAQHLKASMTGEDVPPRASDAYVANLFDRFSSSFDAKLDNLDYRAPKLVGEAVARLAGTPSGDLTIVDAGCGTGKCAVYLKPYAKLLLGVDLSKGMLAKAEALKAYDHLECGELTSFLSAATDEFDFIVSADTLCYFGNLEDFAEAAAKALRPGGSLVFTVEALDDGSKDDFQLAHNGRYVHAKSYVEAALGGGLSIRSIDSDRLRNESGDPVMGFVVVASKR